MAERTIEIPAIDLQTIVIGIEGSTPLITNRFGEKAQEAIEAKQQKKAKVAKEARDPESDFDQALHHLPGGGYGFPAVGIKKALVAAGGRFADEKMTHLRGILNIVGDLIEIKGSKPTMRSDPVRLASGVFSIAYRPMFSPWEMEIPLRFNASMIGEAQILNLFQLAGFAVGLGSWRPECNGVFGQFVLKDSVVG